MSHDLSFCRKSGRSVDRGELEIILAQYPFTKDSSSSGYGYEHPDTGVHFYIDYVLNGDHPSDEEELVIPFDFVDSGIVAHLNFARPEYFCAEYLAFIQRLCQQLDLLIVDPQDPKREYKALPYHAKRLAESYLKGNQWAIQAARKAKIPFRFISSRRLWEWWGYQLKIGELCEKLGDDYFVPRVDWLQGEKKKQSIRASTWQRDKLLVIPPCDRILLFNTEFVAQISRAELVRRFHTYLKREKELKSVLVLRDISVEQLNAEFDRICQETKSTYHALGPIEDQIVDRKIFHNRFGWISVIITLAIIGVLQFGLAFVGVRAMDHYVQDARHAWAAGENERFLSSAKKAYFFAPESRPDHRAYAEYLAGTALYQMREYEQALTHLEHAIELDDRYGVLYVQLGRTYLQLKNLPQAQEALDKALALNSQDAWAHDLAALFYWHQHDFENAIAHYEQAILLAPGEQTFVHRANELREYFSRSSAK